MIVVNFTPCFVVTAASVLVAGQTISCCLIKAAAAQIIQPDFTPSWSAAMEGGWERESLWIILQQSPDTNKQHHHPQHTHTQIPVDPVPYQSDSRQSYKDRQVNLYVIHFWLTRLILTVWTTSAAQSGSAVISGLKAPWCHVMSHVTKRCKQRVKATTDLRDAD